ncbi:hypothetical protein NL676_029911 [Syzygium grande]|nr:hypothetical protein NL676_029911 [Syzygium grande]
MTACAAMGCTTANDAFRYSSLSSYYSARITAVPAQPGMQKTRAGGQTDQWWACKSRWLIAIMTSGCTRCVTDGQGKKAVQRLRQARQVVCWVGSRPVIRLGEGPADSP